jgi:hypothetical protein
VLRLVKVRTEVVMPGVFRSGSVPDDLLSGLDGFLTRNFYEYILKVITHF